MRGAGRRIGAMADGFPDNRLPDHGTEADEVLARMQELRVDDRDWRGGRVFSLVYSAGDQVHELLERAANLYSAENALNTMVFPSLGSVSYTHLRAHETVLDL